MSEGYPSVKPKLPPGIIFDENVYITMRDGVKIAVDIYRPEVEGHYPALVSTSAYLKAAQPWPPELNRSIESGQTFFFVPKGYVHVIVQVRGSGYSQGEYNWYDSIEQQDGYEIIEWAAKQSWCNGSVGMLGDSYYARTQWLIAGQQPPHLKCIVPFNGGMDDYRSRHEGGIIRLGWLSNWSADVICQCMWPGPIEGKLPPTNLMAQICANPDDGPFYWERSGYTKIDKIRVPVLSIAVGGSPLHSPSQLANYPRINSAKKLIVLPFGRMNIMELRSRPANEYMLKWYDYWLKGIDNGIMDEPPVAICDRATGQWRYENEYPLERTQWTKFYLRANSERPARKPPYGILSLEPPEREEPDFWITPDCMELLTAGKPVMAFATPPLDNDTCLWGPLSATLYGSSTTIDTVWFVKVGDVAPDGQITMVSQGLLKASYRGVDQSKSMPGSPFHSFQNPILPRPNEIYEYQIALMPIFNTFKKGHKIWIQLASDDPQYMGEHNTVYNAWEMLPIPAKNTIYHDASHPSHLLLPVIPNAPMVKPVEPPLSEIKWPMRETRMEWPYDYSDY